jgi:hypothetical protein
LVENNERSVGHPENRRAGPMGVAEAKIASKSNVEAVLRDLAERRVDADIEARDVAAPPIIRFLSRPTAITQRAPSARVPTPPDRLAGSARSATRLW